MIGDRDQRLYYEWSSTVAISERIWQVARDLGYGEYFVAESRHHILDDHTPFLQWGVPAALLIDFDYPYWHTTQDTPDKISADSLQRVGRVLETLLNDESPALR
jgi:Zn-dependent M28 family amino/carboxypeptidase